jgi:PncC family amidohydrolase
MQILLPIAQRVAAKLTAAKASLSVAESSAGGLISAALLAVPGASAYFVGGAVVYTRAARTALLGITDADMRDVPPSSEVYAMLLARAARVRFGTVWALAETGATGPAGNRYGYAAGHACFAVAGPVERAVTLETGFGDRQANMRIFAASALELLDGALG